MTDIEHHVQTCHDCHAQAQAIESLLHREAGLAHVPTAVPRRIIDLPYVVGVQDLTSYITRAYTPRRLAIEPLLVIVPDFFKAPIFPSGLLPQQYLARIITILAEILPRNDTLTIDANTTSFIITSLATHSEYHVTQQTIRCETSDRTTTACTDLFLAFYTLWTIPSTLIPASAAALPMPQAQRVRSESTASNLAQLDQFFGTHSHTRRPVSAHLVGIARYLSQNDYPPQLILEPPSSAPHLHPRVPLPELLAGLADPEKSKWPDILAAIRRAANEE